MVNNYWVVLNMNINVIGVKMQSENKIVIWVIIECLMNHYWCICIYSSQIKKERKKLCIYSYLNFQD